MSATGDLKAALAEQERRALLKWMPSWFERSSCKLKRTNKHFNLRFKCPCCPAKLAKQPIYVGESTNCEYLATKLAEKVEECHGCHNHTHEAPEEQPTAREQQLKNELKGTKRKVTMVQSELRAAEAKVAKAADAQAQVTEDKRQASRAARRRVEFNPNCKDSFNAVNKCAAMLAAPTGIVDTLKYWCKGSEIKLPQLIMRQIHHFGLRDRVITELGLQSNETHNYIVSTARDALAILKECHNEEQRQQFRLVTTALAPDSSDEMSRRVAAALDLNRNRNTFTDSVAMRTGINKQAKVKDAPLTIGETVLCRHGKGVLIDYTPACEKINRPAGVCTVRISHGAHTFDSTFPTPGNGKHGARLQREPINFAHDSRSRRCDSTSAELVQKVHTHNFVTADFTAVSLLISLLILLLVYC
jgi:hypothetical protein